MAKLKLGAIEDDKPVRVTIELPAVLHRDLVAYTEALARETAQSAIDPAKLIAPMLKIHGDRSRVRQIATRESDVGGRQGIALAENLQKTG